MRSSTCAATVMIFHAWAVASSYSFTRNRGTAKHQLVCLVALVMDVGDIWGFQAVIKVGVGRVGP